MGPALGSLALGGRLWARKPPTPAMPGSPWPFPSGSVVGRPPWTQGGRRAPVVAAQGSWVVGRQLILKRYPPSSAWMNPGTRGAQRTPPELSSEEGRRRSRHPGLASVGGTEGPRGPGLTGQAHLSLLPGPQGHQASTAPPPSSSSGRPQAGGGRGGGSLPALTVLPSRGGGGGDTGPRALASGVGSPVVSAADSEPGSLAAAPSLPSAQHMGWGERGADT